jgi:hypothetical protein
MNFIFIIKGTITTIRKSKLITNSNKMNTELIAELKTLYRDGFLMTPRGKKHLQMAIAFKREWVATKSKSNVQFNTACVDTTPFGEDFKSKLSKIEIIPIGINNCCHQNADFFSNETDFERRTGWNMTACPCGKFCTLELHSINVGEDGVQYDFTKDFNDETEKYFIVIDKESVMPDTVVRLMGDKAMYMNKGCRCPVNWEKKFCKPNGMVKTSEEDLLNRISFLENVTIYC